MKNSIITSVAVFLGACLFNLIFWHEKSGLNVLIFDVFIIATLWWLNKESFETPSVKIVVGGTLLAAGLVIWHNSFIAKLIHILSFISMVGLVQQRELRFLGYAFLQYFFNWFEVPRQAFLSLKSLPILRGQNSITQQLRSGWMTLFIFPVFYLIYYVANAKFAELSDHFWGNIFRFFSLDIDMARVLFFFFGFGIVGAAIWQQGWVNFLEKDKAFNDNLLQPEIHESDASVYRNALNLVIALNALLLVNNLIDIRYVWFADVSGMTALQLKEYVHEGTSVLIFGIVLAITIILWLFRGGLNFEEKVVKTPSLLRGATTLWLAQNALLALSVGIRNLQYIVHYGLAYKRVGVFVFLALALYGLWLLYLKIKEKRTFFFFIHRGAFGIYAVLLATCFINWDVFITKFNIEFPVKSGSIDVRFLVEDMSNKNLYLLFQTIDKLAPKMPKTAFPDDDFWELLPRTFVNDEERLAYLKAVLNRKKTRFEEEQKGYSWLSWNHADEVNKAFFK